MKKILLIAAMAAIAGTCAYAGGWDRMETKSGRHAQTRAEENTPLLVFGYCQGYNEALGQAGTLSAAIEIPAETAQKWIGAQLTQVRLAFGQASKNTVTVYLSSTLRGTPFYTQDVELETMDGWNTITLDTPYDIDGKGFFIGYKYAGCKAGEYPVGIDGVPTGISYGDNIAVNNQWDHIGPYYGSISIQAVVSGDQLPLNDVGITDISVPQFVKPGEPFDVDCKIVNQGASPLETMTIVTSLAGTTLNTVNAEFTPGLEPGAAGALKITGLVTQDKGIDLPLEVNITAVNGQDDASPEDNTAEAYLASFTGGYKRNVVVEEWTGTWCGFCPRGIVGMSYMKEKYGNDGFIGIAVHGNNGMQRDPMTVSSYAPFLNSFALMGFPGCAMNRMYSFDPNQEDLEDFYKDVVKDDTYVQVESLTAEYNAENPDVLTATASVEFVLPVENGDYKLAFVITENNVGPYPQTNYFAGGAYGKMGGWELKSANQYWYFDEVARDIEGCFGIAGSIPAKVEAGEACQYTTTVSLENVQKLSKCELVAMVLNGRTGEIMNAAHTSLYEAGVENAVVAGAVAITPLRGEIKVEGEDVASATVYTADGRTAGSLEGAGSVAVAPGIYIVKAVTNAGEGVARKVVVL